MSFDLRKRLAELLEEYAEQCHHEGYVSPAKYVEKILELPMPPVRCRLPQDRLADTGCLVIHPMESEEEKLVKYYVTLGYYDDGRLGEVFVRQQKEGSTVGALLDAVATAVSVGLQYGIPWSVFEAKFRHQRFPPSGYTDDPDPKLRQVSSPLDYLAAWVSLKTRFKLPPGFGGGKNG